MSNSTIIPILLIASGLLCLISEIGCQESSSPEMFLRKVLVEDGEKGTMKRISNFRKLSESGEYFHEISTNRYQVDGKVEGFVLSCRADYPVYWNFNQDEGGPFRDEYSGFILYTERNASFSSLNYTNPHTNNYLANLQIIIKRSEFTGNYSCHSVANPDIQQSIFLFIRDKYEEANLVYNGKNLSLAYLGDEELVNLPCLVNSPVKVPSKDDVSLLRMDKIDDNGKEIWDSLPKNESITYDPARGFQLRVSDLPQLLGNYRCVCGGVDNHLSATDFVNITVFKKDTSEDKHFGDPSRKAVIETGAGFELKTFESYFYKGKELTEVVCCSTDDTKPEIYESECFNPADCLSRRKLMAQDKLSQGPNPYNRAWFDNCTSTQFEHNDTVGHVFKCFGNGIYVMGEYFPSLVSDKGHPWARFRSADETGEDKEMLSLKITSTDLEGTGNGTKSRNSTMKSLTAKCHYVEYFISDGLFWKLVWENGTVEWVKGQKNEDNNWTESYRLNSNTYPIELNLKIHVDELSSISCFGPRWNSADWASVTSEVTFPEEYVLEGKASKSKELQP